jgi:hypothetical protein
MMMGGGKGEVLGVCARATLTHGHRSEDHFSDSGTKVRNVQGPCTM